MPEHAVPACAIIGIVRYPSRTHSTNLRWGGAAAVLAGLSYGAAGYLHEPGVSGHLSVFLSVLSFATPALLLGGLLGLRSLPSAQGSLARATGFVLGCVGATLGLIREIGLEQVPLGLTTMGLWWWAPFFGGLTLMGLSAFSARAGAPRFLGVLVLLSGAFGWVSLLSDPDFPGVLMPARPVHVAFAASFCLSCMVWGWMLWRAGREDLARSTY